MSKAKNKIPLDWVIHSFSISLLPPLSTGKYRGKHFHFPTRVDCLSPPFFISHFCPSPMHNYFLFLISLSFFLFLCLSFWNFDLQIFFFHSLGLSIFLIESPYGQAILNSPIKDSISPSIGCGGKIRVWVLKKGIRFLYSLYLILTSLLITYIERFICWGLFLCWLTG